MDVRSEACASEDTTNTTRLADSNVKQLNQPILCLWEHGNDAMNHIAILVRLLRQWPGFGLSGRKLGCDCYAFSADCKNRNDQTMTEVSKHVQVLLA